MKILVVDDSAAMRMLILRTLRQAGYKGHEVEQAGDGAEALEMIRADAPDLVLADWNMPKMSGIDLLKALREEGIRVPFGFVTTESTKPMRRLAAEAGAKFLIAKPFTAESFEKALGTVFS